MRRNHRVLVTGATGFIGRRLVAALHERGYQVHGLSRQQGNTSAGVSRWHRGDLLDRDSLEEALAGIDSAYYLVHSLGASRTRYPALDRRAAENFVAAGERAGLRRAIYLGGLGEPDQGLSKHLSSRAEVGALLQQASFPVTVLRAAVIIGAGGASFEIIRSLVRRLPLMLIPMSIDTPCQPIAVADVIRYLAECLEREETVGQTFDICGPEVLSYHQMLERFAKVSGQTNLYLPIPLVSPRMFAWAVGLASSVKPSIAVPLIEGLKNQVVCRDTRLRQLIPFELTPFEEGVRAALAETIS
ncbi:NADH-binding protein [Desulfuromonas versatilis]|uniref:NADH-binding protein n=1 Tax=Desulfuromonas versatilis TaxID=2802975 RepID=A0ABM8HQS4_9BACT|nr:NAD-dependent epimerase/dehydratase family protein [Desulfuromonas versatilis]BCR04212.1 NADH-binding protein [Desulfuromonas versatilis]